MAALLISILLNAVLLGWVSYEAILSKIDSEKILPILKTESVVTVFPDMFVQASPDEVKSALVESEAVRTSDDQISPEAPKSRRYIGERNTQATSDRAATSDDTTMPSQAGREALPIEEPETTESVYQDGRLDTPLQPVVPNPPIPLAGDLPIPPTPSAEKMKGETQPDPGEAEIAETAIREKLLDGPNVVEKEVPKSEVKENIKPREEKKTRDGDPQGLAVKKPEDQIKPATKPAAAAVNDPAFSGNQSKTAIRGSISRTGRSALDVVDTPMGRYHAQISRAVELEFQRNCVRRRDFIVPGYISVRFFIDAEGRVSTLSLIGDIEGGEVQKGFTIDSIRDAEIPAMPSAVKQEMGDHSLELIYNFIF
ncbi:MAG: hypothetical protein V4727_06620 [Verrucomicrobiota bacterium]